MTTLRMSTLPKTWVLDVDGTIVVHNGHLRPVGDELLPGVKEFFASLPPQDVVVLLTARKKEIGRGWKPFSQTTTSDSTPSFTKCLQASASW